jgi:hypothetical protein
MSEIEHEDAKPKARKTKVVPNGIVTPDFVLYETREREPTMFPCAGYNPIRNFQSGRLEYKVPAHDVERFEKHFFVETGRIVRLA